MKRIQSIDGFRAISICFVLGNHIINARRGVPPLSRNWYMLGNGALGVFIFFVISGYLITTLLLQEQQKTGTISLPRFYFRRTFRIFPPLYFYIAFVALTASMTSGVTSIGAGSVVPWREIATALTFTGNLIFTGHPWQFEHFWSLCIEEQFYLVWPLALFYFLSRHNRAAAARLAIVLILLAPILRLTVFALVHDLQTRQHCMVLLPTKMDGLMYGCWGALNVGKPSFEGLYARASAIIWLLPIWVFTVSNYLAVRFENYYWLSIGQTIDGLFIVMLLVWCARNSGSLAGRILNWGPVVHLGLISYSLYIWQTWFLHADNHTIFGRLPWSLLCIFAMAEFSFYGVERWSRMLRDLCEPIIFRRGKGTAPLRSDIEVLNEAALEAGEKVG